MIYDGIPLRVPFLVVLLLATFWICLLAWWKPQYLQQERLNRLYSSLLEGVFGAVIWGSILSSSTADPIAGVLMSSMAVGVLWSVFVYYNRSQYVKLRASHVRKSTKE